MIYIINKWHMTEGGDTASSVTINKKDAVEAEREAHKQFRQLGANYMADNTVKSWTLMLVDPCSNNVVKKDGYSEPVVPAEE